MYVRAKQITTWHNMRDYEQLRAYYCLHQGSQYCIALYSSLLFFINTQYKIWQQYHQNNTMYWQLLQCNVIVITTAKTYIFFYFLSSSSETKSSSSEADKPQSIIVESIHSSLLNLRNSKILHAEGFALRRKWFIIIRALLKRRSQILNVADTCKVLR